MVWNFNNEKPMSISQINDNELAITVKNIGEFTSQLHDLKIGDKIGIRGSYGHGFDNSFEGKRIIAIGGGVGMAPMNAIARDLTGKNDVDVIVAAQTKDELLFGKSLEESGANVHYCTDDGSFGFEGFATNCLANLLEDSSYDYAFVCGPEIMMKGIFDILEDAGIPGQYSLERYMKCALGVCGQNSPVELGISIPFPISLMVPLAIDLSSLNVSSSIINLNDSSLSCLKLSTIKLVFSLSAILVIISGSTTLSPLINMKSSLWLSSIYLLAR
jgi:dihydroorotate dehydrogenase electron transfer subunit